MRAVLQIAVLQSAEVEAEALVLDVLVEGLRASSNSSSSAGAVAADAC